MNPDRTRKRRQPATFPLHMDTTLQIVLADTLSCGEPEVARARMVDLALIPVMDLLDRQGAFRIGLCLTGTTGEWLERHQPELVTRLRAMWEKGRIEVLGGSFDGALVQALPERDGYGQLSRMQRWCRGVLGQTPSGAWVPGNGWDPVLPRLFARAGVRWTLVGDSLLPEHSRRWAWGVAERTGASVAVVPVLSRLSAGLPWMPVEGVIEALRAEHQAGAQWATIGVSLGAMGHEGRSHAQCWSGADPWVPTLVQALEGESGWLKLAVPGNRLEKGISGGRVTPRMGRSVWEWSLDQTPEANRLHKRMLRASHLVHRLRTEVNVTTEAGSGDRLSHVALRDATAALRRGQGVLPLTVARGLERGDLRHQAWSALTDAEKQFHLQVSAGEEGAGHHRLEVADHNQDGHSEVMVTTPQLQALFEPGRGGCLAELHIWRVGNLVNTLQRRPASWHRQLQGSANMPVLVDEDDVAAGLEPPWEPLLSGPLEQLEEGLSDHLHQDRAPRACFMEHFLGPETTLENLARDQHPDEGNFRGQPYELVKAEQLEDGRTVVALARDGQVGRTKEERRLVRVSKHFTLRDDDPSISASYRVSNRFSHPVESRFAVEFTVNLDSVRNINRFVEVDDGRNLALDQSGVFEEVEGARWVLEEEGIELRVGTDTPARLHVLPLDAPVRTPAGCTLGHQGTCLMFSWPIRLWGYETRSFGIDLRVTRER
jgi:hypothetical protein